jgi:hypothetical protein
LSLIIKKLPPDSLSNSAYGGKNGIFIQMSFPRRPACGAPIGGNLHKKAIL